MLCQMRSTSQPTFGTESILDHFYLKTYTPLGEISAFLFSYFSFYPLIFVFPSTYISNF